MALQKLLTTLTLCLLIALPVYAQDEVQPFAWDEGALALAVPTAWPEPATANANDRPTLALTAPDNGGIITLTILNHVALDASLPDLLREALAAQNTPSLDAPGPATFAGAVGSALSGASADGIYTGYGRVARLYDGRVLLVTALAPVGTQAAFAPLVEQVADSIVPGAGNEPVVNKGYNLLWENNGSPDAPLDVVTALAAGPDGQLYGLHNTDDILIFDAETGDLISRPIHELVSGAVDLAADDSGNVYLANPVCRCVAALSAAGDLLWWADGFGDGEPRQIALAGDALYAGDVNAGGALVRRVGPGVNLPLRPDLRAGRFWLAADSTGELVVLTDVGIALAFDGLRFRLLFADAALPDVRAIEVDSRGNLVVASASGGVVALDSTGNLSERLAPRVAGAPLAGEVVAPTTLATLPDGAIVIADARDGSGHLAALSPGALSLRIGATALVAGQPVIGALNAGSQSQAWTYRGEAGAEITLSAVDAGRTGALDVAVRLLGPDGAEIAYNDDQMGLDLYNRTDAQIARQTLPASGEYTVVVERVQGDGLYNLAVVETASLALNASGVTRLEGALSDAAPVISYIIEGEAGQVITATMDAETGSLDPYLKLYGPDGRLIAWNDDAADYDMGITAQVVLYELPESGAYRLEATRYDGAGRYRLVVVEMSLMQYTTPLCCLALARR